MCDHDDQSNKLVFLLTSCQYEVIQNNNPGGSLITAIYKSEGTVHARGNNPLMLAYFLFVLCLRKNIRAVHAYKNVECIDACTLKLFIINSLDQDKGKR